MRWTLKRLGGMLGVLLIVSFLTYTLLIAAPSDPALMSCGRPCTPDRLADARAFMGYDEPLLRQYLEFLGGIATGRTFGSAAASVECAAPCLGYSFRLGAPVTELIAERAPVTFSLAIGAAVLWLVLGVAAGTISAVKRGSLLDRAAMTLSVAAVSAPAYLVGLIGLLIFGFTLNMVPVAGYVPFFESPVDWAWHLILPWLVLALISAAVYARLTRTQLLEVLGEDFIRTARAKGLREGAVLRRHGLRNTLVPIVTYFGLDLGGLLGGAVLTERVFSMPGLGSLLIDAVGNADLPVIIGVTLFSAAVIVAANAAVDVLHGVLDPRVQKGNR
ncbi:peptide/nickel transport system permease protein [Catenuloplanes nepalensis]|uniref:Peptide/nickel transport system permease protein n=1 Tax=Catenuloplanes nepalensis TaxID=587533 RepID=A0ABT9MUD6_9ACTN|nr:ABC transporter permease [Catenuloplanes nepalensis]MDP9795065.1 peptide/nickel transport system permease protein [Catenuloplanes nepalensis]